MTTTAPTRTAPATHATGRDSVTTRRSATSADNIRARRHHALRPLFGLVVRGVTDRAWLWFLLIGVALGAFTAIIDADVFLTDVNLADQTAVDAVALRLLRLGFSLLLLSALWGAMQVTTEFRDGTVATSITAHHGVGRLVAGHALASLPMGLAFGVIGVLSAGLPTWLIFKQRDLSITMSGELVATALGIVAVCTLAAPWGTCFGWLFRKILPTALVLMVWTMFLEPSLVSALPRDLGQYLPGGLQLTLIGDATAVGSTPLPLASLLLVAWVVVLGTIAARHTRSSDLRA